MSSTLDFDQVGPSSVDVGFGEVLHAVLASLWRRKLLISAIIAMALALGIIALLVIRPSYTPEASIRGGFVASNAVAKDEDSKSGPSVSLDLMRVIETQSRLLESQDLARRVVQQIGLERLQPELKESHWLPPEWLPVTFHGSAGDAKPDETDLAAAKLLRGLSVASDPLRTYLIKVRYTGTDPALAVVITNAFVAEFLRSSKLQTLAEQRAVADAMLSKQLAIFGNKHPNVIKANMRLAAADELIKEQLNEAPEALLQAASENVTKAVAAPAKPSTRLVLGLLLFVGLAGGVASALWLERKRWAQTFSHYVRPFA